MSGFEEPTNAFMEDLKEDKAQASAEQIESTTEAAEINDTEDFDWFGGPADRQADQDQFSSFKDPESESIMEMLKKVIPVHVRIIFFVFLGLILAIPTVLGALGSDLPKYFNVSLHVFTTTGLSILYLPGLILSILQQIAKFFRRSLVWSKTELPSYIESISVPMCVAISGSIVYGLWALELPTCNPDDRFCYWQYVHRLYYVMLGSCLAFAVEVALMRKWCNNYRRQTYQARIIENRFRCYIVEQMKVAAKVKRENSANGNESAAGPPNGGQGLGTFLNRLAGYAPIPIEVTRIARIRDFSWFQKHLNSVVLMEHYQGAGEQHLVSDLDSRRVAKDIFEALCPPERDFLTQEDFSQFVPQDALEDAYYVFDHDRDGEITKLEFRNTIVDIFSEQRHLARAIGDADMAISKLNSIVVTAMWIAVGFFGLIACDMAVQNILTLSLSTILGVNVIIGDIVRSVLSSIMFVFVNHAYDIGDVVLVGDPDNSELLTVQQVNLLTTIFRRWNCQELYFANHILVSMPITNLSRSPDQWERIDFVLSSTVNEQQLDNLRDNLTDFFRQNNADFFTSFDLRAIVAADSGKADSDLDRIKFSLRVRCKPTNDAEKQWNRHSRLLKLVKLLTLELN